MLLDALAPFLFGFRVGLFIFFPPSVKLLFLFFSKLSELIPFIITKFNSCFTLLWRFETSLSLSYR